MIVNNGPAYLVQIKFVRAIPHGSHTLRKTWGYHKRKTHKKDTAVISVAYGHASERQTLEYLCIQPEEIDDLYTQGL